VAQVKAARRGLASALETKKSALKVGSQERPITAFSAPEGAEEVRSRPKQRPGKKQRAAYQKRLVQSGGSASLPPVESRVRLLPTQPKAQATPRPPSTPPPAPWQSKKGKSKGKQKKGKGKPGADHRPAAAGKGQRHQRPPRARG
jgi:hypothetical protein